VTGSLMMKEICSWSDDFRSNSDRPASVAHSVLSSHSDQAHVSVRGFLLFTYRKATNALQVCHTSQ